MATTTTMGSTGDLVDPVRSVLHGLDDAGIQWCHWKSNEALAASAAGVNDLDLLVRRDQVGTCRAMLHTRGFLQALPPASRRIPGVLDYHGDDPRLERPVHVHLHTMLVLGDDMTKNHRLPIEAEYLASCRREGPWLLPAPDFELVVFVLRMVVKHFAWDAMLMLQADLAPSEGREFDQLVAAADPGACEALVDDLLPEVGSALWTRCRDALATTTSGRERVRLERELVRALRPLARRGPVVDTTLKAGRRIVALGRRTLAPRDRRKTLPDGGLVVAVVGAGPGDRARLVADLDAWLRRDLVVHVVSFADDPGRAARRARAVAGRGGIALVADHPATRGRRPTGIPGPDLELDLDRPVDDAAEGPGPVIGVAGATPADRLTAARTGLWGRA